ncbi:flagellin N-terminal helical domain-containing protein [Pontibaca salina]|uniref:Flagellin n=1 Tax=Pontibaca salina TaxID=2795731 RepID=A0A934HWR1_9RHOB|nr:flagellin [Pontibaca salina]MBI6630924.1 flagellar protein [Pontibaca salina]
MTSLITNTSAMNALQQLRDINKNLNTTQDRISSGLKVSSAKDNAAYFQISESMKGDSSAYSAISEGMTLTKNSVATARLGAETFKDLAQQFTERVAFAQGAVGGYEQVEKELLELVKQMETTVQQATFNGDDMVNAAGIDTIPADGTPNTDGTVGPSVKSEPTRDTVTGISREGGTMSVTKLTIQQVDLAALTSDFKGIATGFRTGAETDGTGATYLEKSLLSAETATKGAIAAATTLGLAEKSLENQQDFLSRLVDNLDSGIGSMIDADMEEEAARLKALQTQQQLATQSLSIANNAPQGVLALFQ